MRTRASHFTPLLSLSLAACAGELPDDYFDVAVLGDRSEPDGGPAMPDASSDSTGTSGGGVADSSGTQSDASSMAEPDGGGQDGMQEPPSPSCPDVAMEWLAPRCGTPSCHGAGSSMLDLQSEGLAGRLIDRSGSGDCASELLIDGADPEGSLLYRKLMPSPPCGLQMPLGVTPDTEFTEEELACVLVFIDDLIASGAGMDPLEEPEDEPDQPGEDPNDPVEPDGPDDPEPFEPMPLPRDGWTLSASVTDMGSPLSGAIDGNPGSRWSTGILMMGGEWLQIDLGASETFTRIVLDATGSELDFPVGYRVYASDDPEALGDPLLESMDTATVTTIELEPVTARHVRIEQTGAKDSWWSIHELNIEGRVEP